MIKTPPVLACNGNSGPHWVEVQREGNFTRSGYDQVDEAEIFSGSENTLRMKQTYKRKFQCQYVLDRYPFDVQVII